MGRAFAIGSSEYLEVASTPITAVPLTISVWFWTTSGSGASFRMVSIQDSGSPNDWFGLDLENTGKTIRQNTRSGAGNENNANSGTYSLNTWHHACGNWSAVDARATYLDGGNKTTSAVSITPAGLDSLSIGRTGDSSPGGYADATFAEVAAWRNTVLTDTQVYQLAQGRPPWEIHRANLVGLWLTFGDRTDRDFSGRGYHMTAFNTPTFAADPPEVVRLWRA